jgi:hypothetical protein
MKKRKLRAKIRELELCVESAAAVSDEWRAAYWQAVAARPLTYCNCSWGSTNTFSWCPLHGQRSGYPYTVWCGDASTATSVSIGSQGTVTFKAGSLSNLGGA